jgi:hypothetical protein
MSYTERQVVVTVQQISLHLVCVSDRQKCNFHFVEDATLHEIGQKCQHKSIFVLAAHRSVAIDQRPVNGTRGPHRDVLSSCK